MWDVVGAELGKESTASSLFILLAFPVSGDFLQGMEHSFKFNLWEVCTNSIKNLQTGTCHWPSCTFALYKKKKKKKSNAIFGQASQSPPWAAAPCGTSRVVCLQSPCLLLPGRPRSPVAALHACLPLRGHGDPAETCGKVHRAPAIHPFLSHSLGKELQTGRFH